MSQDSTFHFRNLDQAKPVAFSREPMASGPVIGISAGSSTSKSITAMITMVRANGGTPMLLSNHKSRSALQDIAKVDAVIVMGNDSDIDPAKYGQAAHSKTKIETNKARAQYEEGLIAMAIRHKIPVLGICGGMQRINVLCGGTLHQHIPELVGNNHHAQSEYGIPGFIPVQEVTVRPNTLLARIENKGAASVVLSENSFHHQAVNLVPEGLRVNAISKDGIAQGIEAAPGGKFDGQYIMGVQWHPEFAASSIGPKLVQHVIAEGQQFARSQNRKHHAAESMVESLQSILPDVIEHQLAKHIPQHVVNALPGGAVERLLQERSQNTAIQR